MNGGGMVGWSSPFLDIPVERWTASNASAFAVFDLFPVSQGHTLVITRRPIADWWRASRVEQRDLMALVDIVKRKLDESTPRPDGYNVGFNSGEAAGQTVPHLHLHVIPRYNGDVLDPRGGVRHVIPGRGNYLARPLPALLDGPSRPLGPSLADAFEDERIDRIDVAVSFVMQSGLDRLAAEMGAAISRRGMRMRILTTNYLGITERGALERLLADSQQFPESLEVRVFDARSVSFHPKAYLFGSAQSKGVGYGFVGSANLSGGGISTGIEWSLRTDAPLQVEELRSRFEGLWSDECSLPLTSDLLAGYQQAARIRWPNKLEEEEAPEAPFRHAPTEIQSEALTALEESRGAGFKSGMVVLATGLGKTWLAAFDCGRPKYRRVLFLAHREEILLQAIAVFRRVLPLRSHGLLTSKVDDSSADIVFASVQTFVNRMGALSPDDFDYVVIDEFHHAASPTYQRILGFLEPAFMLGLTATPDRTDGADLLALCDDNVIYEASLAEGIARGALVPFEYLGVPDTIVFDHIPWRNGQFDPKALEFAASTSERAEAALREWESGAGDRTLAFCVSVHHAEFMADFFRRRGVLAEAVHASAGSAPRHQTLDALARGDVKVVFSVDLLNEGVDVPTVDTVLMLRPTSSAILFLQQLGRGLRLSPGKQSLTVIDFVGNHRSFLLKPRWLLGLTGKHLTDSELKRVLLSGDYELPPGCTIGYRLEARSMLEDLLRMASRPNALIEFIANVVEETGQRPSAVQAHRAGFNPASLNPQGGWFSVLDSAGLLTETEASILGQHADMLKAVAVESMTKSYKMVTLRALTMAGALADGMTVSRLSTLCHRLMLRDPRLVADATSASMPDPEALDSASWRAYWRKWPVAALLGELKGGGSALFAIEGDEFRLAESVAPEHRGHLDRMVGELVDWRLARYLERKSARRDGVAVVKVAHNGRTPMLFLDRDKNPELPQGKGVRLVIEERVYKADFVKIAINVARLEATGPNELPDILWSWFGPDAGMSGTQQRVAISVDASGEWHMRPMSDASQPNYGWAGAGSG